MPQSSAMILLVIFLAHFAVASKDDPNCWFEGNRWDGMARSSDLRIPSKIKQDTGYNVNMHEPIMAVQLEEKKDEASYLLVLAQVEGKKVPLCFKGRVKDQQVLSMKLQSNTNCRRYLNYCKNYGLSRGFIKEWNDYITRMSKG